MLTSLILFNSAKQEWFLTVTLYPEVRPSKSSIRPVSLWLEQAGFAPQSIVRVRVMRGCLVITAE